jgi:hypothetical protein
VSQCVVDGGPIWIEICEDVDADKDQVRQRDFPEERDDKYAQRQQRENIKASVRWR